MKKMTKKSDETSDVAPAPEVLGGRSRQLIRQSLTQRFSAFLKPGEKLDIEAEHSDEYIWARIRLSRVDESFQLDVEASILAADQTAGGPWDATRYLELGIEFLKLQLYEFFRQDRDERFHIDWRLYPVEAVHIRFRGLITMPSVEREADAFLKASGEGDEAGMTADELLGHDPTQLD
ncbi:hypothetical protein DN745_09690 [Bradymonas sediminis]|uniref:Uncharacterized protein n=2 Tax=Bradymonas sediminis TaxID=1548548 RepID=A0A2Z4FLN0_9DELT|nr:hypothetical protein DN745_09690 [Bradymonas sediminis]